MRLCETFSVDKGHLHKDLIAPKPLFVFIIALLRDWNEPLFLWGYFFVIAKLQNKKRNDMGSLWGLWQRDALCETLIGAWCCEKSENTHLRSHISHFLFATAVEELLEGSRVIFALIASVSAL